MSADQATLGGKKRVAIFVESHEGYGHFNIVSQLARKLQDQGAEVMVLSGTLNYAGAGQTFNFKNARIVHLPLVEYHVTRGGKWEYVEPLAHPHQRERTPYDSDSKLCAKRKQLVCDAISDFKPDAVITELHPFQQSFRSHDVDAVKEACATLPHKPIMLSLCRDIIHNNDPDEVVGLLHKHYDRILVRGDETFTRLHHSQSEWAGIKLPVEYMGNYITPMPERNDMPDNARHVVVFGGGGFFMKDLPFLEGIIRSRKHSKAYGDRIWDIYVSENAEKHFVTDPKDHTKKINVFDYLEQLAGEEGRGSIRVFEPIESKKFRKQLANAAVAVTRGGYNTTFELYAGKVPQLVVPRQDKEQVQRAKTLYANGMAQVFPEDVEKVSDISAALKDPASIAKAIDECAQISASVPVLNNHGATTTAKRVLQLVKQRDMKPLNLLILYEDNKFKKHDALELARHLRADGHLVTLADAEKTPIVRTKRGRAIELDGEQVMLASFDGAAFRSPTELKATREFSEVLRAERVPVYQDFGMMEVAADKYQSQLLFEKEQVPSPKTLGMPYDRVPLPGAVEGLIKKIGAGPYVVKAARGWSGKQVKVLSDKDEGAEAVAVFKDFLEKARQRKEGGAIVQEFIESDPTRRFDYRIQTVSGLGPSGELEVKVVAAAKRKAQPGQIITNVSLGADKIRVSLSAEEAREFYVERGGMEEDVFKAKLASGEIEVLSPKLRDAAVRAAKAFGSGSLGVDVVQDKATGNAYVLEVNPFASGSRNFEEVHGFQIYEPWAESFAEHTRQERRRQAAEGQGAKLPRSSGGVSGAGGELG